MDKMKNIKMLIAALLLAVGIVGVGSTVAFLTSSDEIVNTIEIMAVPDTSLDENIDPDDVQTETDILKQPYVKNNGAAACIRARITISPSDLDVTLKSGTWTINGQTLSVYEPVSLVGNKTFTSISTVYTTSGGFSDVKDASGKGWIYSDGWYYYNVVTESGTDHANTTTLFDAVYLGKNVPDDAEIEITVYQESVYAADHLAGEVLDINTIKALFEK
jgi:hypothetical protein